MGSGDGKVTVVAPGYALGVKRPRVSRDGPVHATVEGLVRATGPTLRPWEAEGAIEVERLVTWAFRDQKVDAQARVGLHHIEAVAAGLDTGGRSSDGCAALADIENLGCRIDRRVTVLRDTVHPAALAVSAAVDGLASGWLVKHHGRLGGRPDGWREPERWYRPVVWVKPGVEGQWERTGRGNSPRFCRVIPTVTRDELARRRAEYGAWWEALDQLAWLLSMKALGFAVRPPTAPREPWAEAAEAGAARVVHQEGGEGERGTPLRVLPADPAPMRGAKRGA